MINSIPLLHVYEHQAWHDDVYVVGNKSGLEALRDAVNKALTEDNGEADDVFVIDGEGYRVCVMQMSADEIEQLSIPYTYEYAKEKSKKVKWPSQVWFERVGH